MRLQGGCSHATPSSHVWSTRCAKRLACTALLLGLFPAGALAPPLVGTIIVDVEPDSLNAPWHLQDLYSFSYYGAGDDTLTYMNEGYYTLTWQDVPGWLTPTPNPVQQFLPAFDVITFNGTYTLLPPVSLSGTVPVQNALDVPLSVNISATFDSDMDTGSINDSTFVVNGTCSGPHGGAISYDAPSRTASLDPAVDFTTGEIVTVVLTDIKSALGAPLADHVWSFTTAASGGSGAFPDQVLYEAWGGPTSIIVCEFDSDGDLDLATANRGSNTVSVLLNHGDGTFSTEFVYSVGQMPSSLCGADLDGDGAPDLAITNHADATVSVLRNQGNGTFAADSTYVTGLQPNSVFSSDFDADGALDLATANYFGDVSVLLNHGDGTFAPLATYYTGWHLRSLSGADFDGDGDIDLAITSEDWGVSVLPNQGDGTFGPDTMYSGFNEPFWVFGADLNGDRHVDLATAHQWADEVAVSLNDGNGAFTVPTVYAAGDGPVSIFASDLDGDGDLDLTTANANSDDLSVFLNQGDGTFGPHMTYAAADNPHSVFAADLDGDGDLDLATANFASDSVSVLMNNEAVGGALTDTNPTPADYALHQSAPNPFGAGTTIRFALPRAAFARLEILNVLGQRVRLLTNDKMDAGRYSSVWDGRDAAGVTVAPGVYFVRLESGDFTATHKVVRMQ